MLFPSQKPLVSLDIGSHSIKLAQLRKTKKGYELLNFGMIQLPPDSMVEGEVENSQAVMEALKNLVKAEKIKNKDVVMGISGQSVIIKKISVPVMTEDELAEMIREEAEQYIPFDIDEVNLDFQIVKTEGEIPTSPGQVPAEEEGKQMDVLIVAARKETVQVLLDIAKEVGLNVKVLDLDVFALENAFEFNYDPPTDETIALVNIGATMTNVNIIEAGVTAYTRDIATGGNTISEEIQKNLSIGFSEAEKLKLGILIDNYTKADLIPHVQMGIELICDDLKKTFDMYEKTADFKVSKIYLSGATCLMDGADQLVARYTGLETELANSFRNIDYNQKTFDPEYVETMGVLAAIPVGLALRMVGDK